MMNGKAGVRLRLIDIYTQPQFLGKALLLIRATHEDPFQEKVLQQMSSRKDLMVG